MKRISLVVVFLMPKFCFPQVAADYWDGFQQKAFTHYLKTKESASRSADVVVDHTVKRANQLMDRIDQLKSQSRVDEIICMSICGFFIFGMALCVGYDLIHRIKRRKAGFKMRRAIKEVRKKRVFLEAGK